MKFIRTLISPLIAAYNWFVVTESDLDRREIPWEELQSVWDSTQDPTPPPNGATVTTIPFTKSKHYPDSLSYDTFRLTPPEEVVQPKSFHSVMSRVDERPATLTNPDINKTISNNIFKAMTGRSIVPVKETVSSWSDQQWTEYYDTLSKHESVLLDELDKINRTFAGLT